MDTKKEFPKLAAPALRALANAKITSLKQLTKFSEAEIMALHGIGNNAMATLIEALKKNSLSFKTT
jgi:DNA-directed RNA polymerase alpha subunit